MLSLTAHMVIKNEDQWVWFSIMSVLPYVTKILIFDTGSSDKTEQLVKSINSKKIIYQKVGLVSRSELVKLRQQQIDQTSTKWFLVLDGDEIWSKSNIEHTIKTITTHEGEIIAVVNRTRNCIGDVWHYLAERYGKYKIGDQTGNLNIRFIKKVPGLKITGEYPLEYFEDQNGKIQEQVDKLIFVQSWYLHTSFLKRSSSDNKKVSGSFGKSKIWNKGIQQTEKELPEILFSDYPEIIDDPLKKRGLIYEALAQITTPILDIKNIW